MSIRHTVVQGESVARLAEAYGLAPDTIWQHEENAALREQRSNRDALLPGDVVVIPDKRIVPRDAETGKRHRFVRKGVPMPFAMQLIGPDGPRGSRPYVLTVDGKEYRGSTDEEGCLRLYLPNSSQAGTLVIGERELVLEVHLGEMDPIETVTGVQKRLANMRFPCGVPDGEMNPATVGAIESFQRFVGLEVTGTLDDETRRVIGLCHDTPGELTARNAAARKKLEDAVREASK